MTVRNVFKSKNQESMTIETLKSERDNLPDEPLSQPHKATSPLPSLIDHKAINFTSATELNAQSLMNINNLAQNPGQMELKLTKSSNTLEGLGHA